MLQLKRIEFLNSVWAGVGGIIKVFSFVNKKYQICCYTFKSFKCEHIKGGEAIA